MINHIIQQVTHNPKYGIAVKDNTTNTWLFNFSTLAMLQSNGFNTVGDALNDIEEKGYKSITVFLKRKNGSSNSYVLQNKQPIKQVLEKTKKTNVEASENVVEAVAVNNAAAPALPQANTPTPAPPMVHTNQQPVAGLLGYDPDVLQVYSDSQQKQQFQTELEKVKAENDTLKKETNDQKFKILELNNKVEVLENKPKQWISDKAVETSAPIIAQLFQVFADKKAVGLGAPATQQENYSEVKTNLLNMVKHEQFTDDYCKLFFDLINKGVSEPETLKQIQQLVQPQ